MKKLLIALVSIASLASINSFAQTLDAAFVTIDGNPAVLQKTEQTPKSVTLQVKVPTQVKRCNPEDYAYREVRGIIRYESVPRVVCNGGYQNGGPRNGGVVVRRHPSNPRHQNPRHQNPRNHPQHRRNSCHTVYQEVPVYGMITEKYCVAPYYATVNVDKTFQLKFNKFQRAASILFSLDEYDNAEVTVSDMPEDCVKIKIYNNKRAAKLTLKRSCR